MGHDVHGDSRQRDLVEEADPDQVQANVSDGGEGQEPLEVLLRECHHGTHHRGENAHAHQNGTKRE